MSVIANPILGSANLATNAIVHGITINKLNQIQRVLPSILQMSRIYLRAVILKSQGHGA